MTITGSGERELVVLGTASQVPTRTRNHNGYVLRWDGQTVLFDPGEGTQRQLTLAGVSPTRITAICITHAHGDHCLGLPGVLQRLSLEGVTGPVPLVYPAAAEEFIDRLRRASAYEDRLERRPPPGLGGGSGAPPAGAVARGPAPPPPRAHLRLPAGRAARPADAR